MHELNRWRKKIQISETSLRDSIENQIMQLVEILDEEDKVLFYKLYLKIKNEFKEVKLQ